MLARSLVFRSALNGLALLLGLWTVVQVLSAGAGSAPLTGVSAFNAALASPASAPLIDACAKEEEDRDPSYCDQYYACGFNLYICRLSARTADFGFHWIGYCPACAPGFSPVAQPDGPSRSSPPAPTGALASPLPAAAGIENAPFRRVSVATGGSQATGGGSIVPALSATGQFVTFDSSATNLVAGDANAKRDVFVHDTSSGVTSRVSMTSTGVEGNGNSFAASLSADGRYVAFLSEATNLVVGDTNGFVDVFVHDRQTGQTECVNLGVGNAQSNGSTWNDLEGLYFYENHGLDNRFVAISGDGRYVAFTSGATNLVAGDTNNLRDVFLRDRQAGVTTRVSVASGIRLAMSSDARFIAFDTPHAVTPADTNGKSDVYVHDRQTEQTTRESISSLGVEGDKYSGWPSISNDGRFVAFASDASNLVAGDPFDRDVFLRDRQLGTTTRVSASGARSIAPSISGDGRRIVFARSYYGGFWIQVFDRLTGSKRLVSLGIDGNYASGSSFGAAISPDGSTLAFASAATNLVTGDTNGRDDVFVSSTANLVANGNFSAGSTRWASFGSIVSSIVGGVFEYYRSTSFQAVVFQQTLTELLPSTGLDAQFDIGNSSSVRKRISVLIHDLDFSDLSVCTFWLEPGAPMRTYRMRTHTTEAWTDAAISFYAASVGSNGGNYQLDNVAMIDSPTVAATRTDCVDPTAPAPPGGAPSGELLTNGDFSGGMASWGTFGQILFQIASGVFDFTRPPGTPSGVVLQASNDAMTVGQIMTAAFQLGNTSAVRKRVTVLLHDGDFSDLSACTFWLPPGLPLSSYAMRTFATKAWANATVSFYPSTVGAEQWSRLDNVTLQRTPGSPTFGTDCIEPGGVLAPASLASGMIAAGTRSRSLAMTDRAGAWQPSDGFQLTSRSSSGSEGPGWRAIAATSDRQFLRWRAPIDLREIARALLSFRSWLSAGASSAHVEVSLDGVSWHVIATLPETGSWTTLNVDLSDFAGQLLHVRFVFDAVAPSEGQPPDHWQLSDVRVDTRGAPPGRQPQRRR